MPFQVLEMNGRPIKMWLPKDHEVEEEAIEQLGRVSRMPFVTNLACMPDVHVGKGATVGSVIATERAIIPAAVGVDIGCGMVAERLHLTADDLPDNLHSFREAIEKAVPHGRTNHGQQGDRGAWGNPPLLIEASFAEQLGDRYVKILQKHPKVEHKYAMAHLGTLGTGNHFVELCLDEEDQVWIMLHSGSRGPGNKIGSYFIDLAKEDMRIHHINLEDGNLSYLSEGTQGFSDYVEAVSWAQEYAALSRRIMLHHVRQALRSILPEELIMGLTPMEEAVNCHHNYVTKEQHRGRPAWITRKGAVQAREGTLGIIPGSMGTKSFIVRGKGNPDSLHSCSHGAGRIMSRTAAKKLFTVEDLVEQTKGVECRKDLEVIDEIPGSYKDIDAVMEAQEDLVEVVHTLKQVLCVKG